MPNPGSEVFHHATSRSPDCRSPLISPIMWILGRQRRVDRATYLPVPLTAPFLIRAAGSFYLAQMLEHKARKAALLLTYDGQHLLHLTCPETVGRRTPQPQNESIACLV